MTKEELINGLTECGVKKKEIEEKLGMPKNSLSGMISGSKPIPEKWFVLLEGFLSGNVAEVKATGIIEEKINKQVENFVNLPTTETELKGIIPAKEPEKIVLPKAKDIILGADYLADVPKITFHELLIEFNSLVQDKPQVNRELEEKLYNLTLKAKNSDLPPRQSEAIRERCINYLTGQYGTKSKK